MRRGPSTLTSIQATPEPPNLNQSRYINNWQLINNGTSKLHINNQHRDEEIPVNHWPTTFNAICEYHLWSNICNNTMMIMILWAVRCCTCNYFKDGRVRFSAVHHQLRYIFRDVLMLSAEALQFGAATSMLLK